MGNYLSKLVSRASGITEPATFQPDNRHRFYNNKPADDHDPFENREDFTEETIPTHSYEMPAYQSMKVFPVRDENNDQNDLPVIQIISNNNEQAGEVLSEQKKKFTPFSPEKNVSNTSSKIRSNIRSNTIRTEKHPDENPIDSKKQMSKKDNNTREQFRTYHATEQGKSDYISPDETFNKNSGSREKISKENGKENIREIYIYPKETTHPFILKKEVIKTTSEPVDNIKPQNKNNKIVSEILPKSPRNKQLHYHFQNKQKERRLIIGSIKVEVVSPQPAKASQAPIKKIHNVIKKQRGQKNSTRNNKLRFGLGQV